MTPSRSYRVTTPRNGKPRGKETLLYKRWRDMRSRCHGRATRTPEAYEHVTLGFKDFAEFRAFALANGFSKRNNSPDRISVSDGYVPGNIRFVPPKLNCCRALPQYEEQDYVDAAECNCGRGADPHKEWCDDFVPF